MIDTQMHGLKAQNQTNKADRVELQETYVQLIVLRGQVGLYCRVAGRIEASLNCACGAGKLKPTCGGAVPPLL